MELFSPKIIITPKLMLLLLLLLSLSTIIISFITQPPLGLDELRTPLGAVEAGSYFQHKKTMKGTDERWPTMGGGGGGSRRLLSGPGSFPPRCTLKCGRCVPCKPVHVPVPPGTPVTAEYYPEAWRCKCGNKYYMP